MANTRMFVLALALAACHRGIVNVDSDGDGFLDGEDCEDHDPSAHPGADEVAYDGVDQNCVAGDDHALHFARIAHSQSAAHPAGPRFATLDNVVQVSLLYEGDGAPAWSMDTWHTDGSIGLDNAFGPIPDPSLVLGRTLDAVLRPDFIGLFAASVTTPSGDLRAALMWLAPREWGWSGYGPEDTPQPFDDVAISDDGDELAVVGCGAAGISWLGGPFDAFGSGDADTAFDVGPVVACEVQGREVRALGGDGTVTAYTPREDEDFDAGRTWSGVVGLAWEPEGMLLVREDGLTLETEDGATEIPTAARPAIARLDFAPDGVVFVVYADEDGALYLLDGVPGDGMTETFLGEGWANADLDVEASEDALFVATRSGDDAWVAVTERVR